MTRTPLPIQADLADIEAAAPIWMRTSLLRRGSSLRPESMALFGRNFILLVEEGVTLPANLQGLCECRYSGEELDMPATMTLFKAFNDFTRPLVLPVGADHVMPQMLQYERGSSVSVQQLS